MRNKMAKLLYCERIGATKDQWFPIQEGDKVTFGRLVSNHIRLFSEFISREHAIIEKNNGQLYITDLKSLNGIHVNEIKIKSNLKHPLKVGDKVEIGKPLDVDEWKHLQICDRFIYEVKEEEESHVHCRPAMAKVHKSLFSVKQHESRIAGRKRKHENSEIVTTQPEQDNISLVKENTGCVSEKKTCAPSHGLSSKEVHFFESDSTSNNNSKALIHSEEKDPDKNGEAKTEQHFHGKEIELRQELLREKELATQREKEVVLAAQKQGEEQAKKDVVVKLEEELQCIICSELFVKSITLNCGHTFCKFCIDGWLKKKDKVCPLCRAEVTSRNHSLVLDNYISVAIAEMSPELQERRKALIQERADAETAEKNKPKPAKKRKRKRR